MGNTNICLESGPENPNASYYAAAATHLLAERAERIELTEPRRTGVRGRPPPLRYGFGRITVFRNRGTQQHRRCSIKRMRSSVNAKIRANPTSRPGVQLRSSSDGLSNDGFAYGWRGTGETCGRGTCHCTGTRHTL